jgi:hypothetical protein
MVAQQQKAAAAQVAGCRMHHGQGKAGGHSGVHGVAARAQRFKARVGGEMVDADHHGVPCAHRLLIAIGKRVLLGEGEGGDEERCAEQGCQNGE